MQVTFGVSDLKEAHPNTAQLRLTGVTGRKLEVVGESIGGSRINIAKIDGIDTNFSGDYPTLVVHNIDQPGHVSEVTSMLAHKSVNIAAMQLYRQYLIVGGMPECVMQFVSTLNKGGNVSLK